jgi:radical SAM protein with 4Fe4S-binding SPASM domain
MEEKRMDNKQFTCCKAFCTVEIHNDGTVYPCCPSWINNYDFGNIFESDFDAIWNSGKAREFRKNVINGKYAYCNFAMCQGTSLFHNGESAAVFSSGEGTAVKYPEYVKFCHDRSCNIRCVTCRDEVITNPPEKTRELDALIGTHFLPLLKDARTVALNGEGELFTSRHCRRLVKEIADKYPRIKFALCSNGILCDEKNCADLNILDKITSVQISVNAASKTVYDTIMRGGDFDRVKRNVEWLSSLKKEGRIDVLRLVFVVSSINYREMEQFMKWAVSLDALVDFWEYRPWGNEMAKTYAEYAVFDPAHREYKDLVKILQNDVFKHPNCRMDGVLRGVDISKAHRGIFYRGVKKIKRKIDNLKTLHNERKIDRYKLSLSYYGYFIKDINSIYGFKNKNILEIGADLNLECIKAAVKLGARSAIACNPRVTTDKKSDKKIHIIKDLGEALDVADESIDLIYGIALLEHVINPAELAEKISKMLKKGGHAYLQGNPMWTSPKGHHVYLCVDDTNYSFDESNGICPVDDWYHLSCPAFEDFEQTLIKKGVPARHISAIYNQIFTDPHLSRLTPSQIITAFQGVKSLDITCRRQKTEYGPDESSLPAGCSIDDLTTCGLWLYITKL